MTNGTGGTSCLLILCVCVCVIVLMSEWFCFTFGLVLFISLLDASMLGWRWACGFTVSFYDDLIINFDDLSNYDL